MNRATYKTSQACFVLATQFKRKKRTQKLRHLLIINQKLVTAPACAFVRVASEIQKARLCDTKIGSGHVEKMVRTAQI